MPYYRPREKHATEKRNKISHIHGVARNAVQSISADAALIGFCKLRLRYKNMMCPVVWIWLCRLHNAGMLHPIPEAKGQNNVGPWPALNLSQRRLQGGKEMLIVKADLSSAHPDADSGKTARIFACAASYKGNAAESLFNTISMSGFI